MKLPLDGEAALFSVKCFIAAMLAYYVALSIGLTRPFWAITTSYIIAQPLAGAVLSKAVFRMIGTALGATAAVVLVPAFVNEPIVLSAALASWLALCIYIAQLDRTPRAYTFLLAGYTASIIGFPSVAAPGHVFDVAIVRVQEISIGILCASLIHGAVFPRTVTGLLLGRIDAILADARRWTKASLAGARGATLDAERRRLAVDLAELHQLSVHLPFDTARLLPRVRTVRALQDQLSLLLPLASTVEDRVAALIACPEGLPAPLAALIERIEAWLEAAGTMPDRGPTAQALIDEAAALEPATVAEESGAAVWHDMLLLNLLSRLADLVAAARDCHDLRDQIRSPSNRAISANVAGLLARTGRRSLHLDRGLAVRSAMGTVVTLGLGCTFWIGTAWADGAGAALIAAICCALFGSLDNPGPAIVKMQIGSTIGLVTAIFYGYVIFPRVTDFVTLAAAVAPALLIMGSLMGTPRTSAIGLGIVIGFPQAVGFNATYQPNFTAAINGALAQFVGIGFATITVGLFQTIGTENSAARLIRAGWRDVAARACGRAPDTAFWVSRMLDRVGLLVPRLAAHAADPGTPLLDALVDLRVGVVAGELGKLGRVGDETERAAVAASLAGVDRYFRSLRPSRPERPSDALLGDIDRTVAAFADDPEPQRRREGLVLLTSLRRNLFPSAPPYGEIAA